jgi:hypothetical protein
VPAELCAVRLCGVPDDFQAVPSGCLRETWNIRRAAEQVDRNKRFRPGRYAPFNFLRSERAGFRVHIGQHRLAACRYDHGCCCGEGKIRNDDFVAGLEKCVKGEEQGGRPGGDGDGVTGAGGAREFLLEFVRDTSRPKVAALENLFDPGNFAVVKLDPDYRNLANRRVSLPLRASSIISCACEFGNHGGERPEQIALQR